MLWEEPAVNRYVEHIGCGDFLLLQHVRGRLMKFRTCEVYVTTVGEVSTKGGTYIDAWLKRLVLYIVNRGVGESRRDRVWLRMLCGPALVVPQMGLARKAPRPAANDGGESASKPWEP